MSEEQNEGKVLIFNPSWFILKVIFSIGVTILVGNETAGGMAERGGIPYVIFSYVFFSLHFGFWHRFSAFPCELQATSL